MPAVFGSAAVLQTGVQEGLLLHKLMCPKLRAIPTSQTAYPLAKQHLDKYKEDVDDDERHCGHTRTQSTQRQPSAVKTQRCADQTAQECGQRTLHVRHRVQQPNCLLLERAWARANPAAAVQLRVPPANCPAHLTLSTEEDTLHS